MNWKFVDWYTQALGAACGLVACVYAYLNGFMFVYGNIDNHFDYLGFDGVLSSYFLYPLCIVTLILGIIRYFMLRKDILNISFENVNIFIIVATVILGFMGAKIYFMIPALLITFNISRHYIFKNKEINDIHSSIVKDDAYIEDKNNTIVDNEILKDYSSLLHTKKDMAISLLSNNSNTQFITEITGLSIEEINSISKEINKKI